ncbi:hypothetical protein N9W03_07015 [Planktomarina temperata]|nr:hypothetical protein [Planktomarina temperata]
MVLNLFKSATKLATESKASAAGPVIAYHSSGRVVWSARDAVSITRSGFQGNPVGFRAVKLISEAASAVPLLLQSAEQRFDTHPILTLIGQPNPSQGRADLFEAIFGQLMLHSAAMQSLDGVQGLLELQVAQLSESFGPGLRRKFRFTI